MEQHGEGMKMPPRLGRPCLTAVRLTVAGAGVLSLALGLAQGGYRDTLGKAVRICLECIGIG